MHNPVIKLIIPARNEEGAIGQVVTSVIDAVDQVIVADNGSTDKTASVAKAAGAHVVYVDTPGYGRACLAAVEAAGACDILVFMDGDASDDPEDLSELINPIINNNSDLVIGSRILGDCDPGSLTPQQRFGNTLACWLMHLIWGFRFSDLGPFRAIRKSSYDRLNMEAPTFGWTVEMQVRALKQNLRCAEVPVHYRKRIGVSKISGTFKGVILAGWYILGTIGLEAIKPNPKVKSLSAKPAAGRSEK
ncbi:glycosyltransferase family 2 protein [Litorimonas sp. WD9-15]|uniref:glycosyltransferase family 2 protein n=1 Tax=Litorimonas sp. WD9-15 TaxID=3418716 RepID=UPI003CFD8A85